ncbi:MAG: hypothetical protein M1818_002817 [Claussenomyces sp. TS43310]|nr:MAG: hypothetical protein M1818_002817 [Claussenomyces sp. TS43310]
MLQQGGGPLEGGLIANDCGTGKTVIACAAITASVAKATETDETTYKPTLDLCPPALVDVCFDDIQKDFAPGNHLKSKQFSQTTDRISELSRRSSLSGPSFEALEQYFSQLDSHDHNTAPLAAAVMLLVGLDRQSLHTASGENDRDYGMSYLFYKSRPQPTIPVSQDRVSFANYLAGDNPRLPYLCQLLATATRTDAGVTPRKQRRLPPLLSVGTVSSRKRKRKEANRKAKGKGEEKEEASQSEDKHSEDEGNNSPCLKWQHTGDAHEVEAVDESLEDLILDQIQQEMLVDEKDRQIEPANHASIDRGQQGAISERADPVPEWDEELPAPTLEHAVYSGENEEDNSATFADGLRKLNEFKDRMSPIGSEDEEYP